MQNKMKKILSTLMAVVIAVAIIAPTTITAEAAKAKFAAAAAAKTTVQQAKTTLNEARTTLKNVQNDLESGKKAIDSVKNIVGSCLTEIAATRQWNYKDYAGDFASIKTHNASIEKARTAIDNAIATIDKANKVLGKADFEKNTIDSAKAILSGAKTNLDSTKTTIYQAGVAVSNAQNVLGNAAVSINEVIAVLENSLSTLSGYSNSIAAAKNSIAAANVEANKAYDALSKYSSTASAGFKVTAKIDKLELSNGEEGIVPVEVTGGVAPYTYKWMYTRGAKGTDWREVTNSRELRGIFSGGTTDSLSIIGSANNFTNGTYLMCKVTDSNGVTLTTKNIPVTVAVSELKIAPHTTHINAYENTVYELKLSVSGGVAPYKYSWQYKLGGNGRYSWNSVSLKPEVFVCDGTDTLTFAPKTDWASEVDFRCVVTDSQGNRVTSSNVSVSVSKGLKFKTAPTDAYISNGIIAKGNKAIAEFNAEITGGTGNYTYQWQVAPGINALDQFENIDRFSWAKAEGGKLYISTSEYMVNDYVFRCFAKDSAGNGIFSNNVFIKYAPLKILNQPRKPVDIKKGDKKLIPLTVEVYNGIAPYTYQWQLTDDINSANPEYINITPDMYGAGNSDRVFFKNNSHNKATGYFDLSVTTFYTPGVRCKITDAAGDVVYTNMLLFPEVNVKK